MTEGHPARRIRVLIVDDSLFMRAAIARALAAGPFDVAVEAQSEGRDPELVSSYAEAGLTWWIEKLGWFRGPVDTVRQRIEQARSVIRASTENR